MSKPPQTFFQFKKFNTINKCDIKWNCINRYCNMRNLFKSQQIVTKLPELPFLGNYPQKVT